MFDYLFVQKSKKAFCRISVVNKNQEPTEVTRYREIFLQLFLSTQKLSQCFSMNLNEKKKQLLNWKCTSLHHTAFSQTKNLRPMSCLQYVGSISIYSWQLFQCLLTNFWLSQHLLTTQIQYLTDFSLNFVYVEIFFKSLALLLDSWRLCLEMRLSLFDLCYIVCIWLLDHLINVSLNLYCFLYLPVLGFTTFFIMKFNFDYIFHGLFP